MDEEIQRKTEEYQKFIDTVLQPNLEAAKKRGQTVQDEIREYEKLCETLQQSIPSSHIVDLGYGKVQCNATTISKEEPMIFVNVGLGFHLEMSRQEASQFCKRRILYLKADPLRHRLKEVDKIQAHIREAQMILDALAQET